MATKSYADSIDLFVDEKQEYPKDLKLYPKSYTIYLDEEDYNPIEKVLNLPMPEDNGD